MNKSSKLRTPNKQGIVVPVGYIVCHPRWNGSDLVGMLKAKANVTYVDEIGEFDFLPSSFSCIIYITESDCIENINNCKRRIAKLRNADGFAEKYVLVDKTDTTKDNFSIIQEFVVLDCDMFVIPLDTNCSQAVDFILQIVKSTTKQSNSNSNIFMSRKCSSFNSDIAILSAMQKIPHIGNTKAKLLLEKFGSIQAIVDASNQELASIIGQASALKLKNFFTQPLT